MKKMLVMLLALVMLISVASVTAVSAYADDGSRPEEFWGTVNQYCSWSVTERSGFSIESLLSVDGSVPPGMYYEVDSMGRLIVSGTPYSAGDYRVSFSMEVTDNPGADGANVWGDSVSAIFHIEGNKRDDYTLPDYFAQLNAGQEYWLSFDMDSAGSIDNYRLKSGNLPDGMYGDMDNNALYIGGTPTRAGDFYFVIAAHNYDYDCWVSQPICLSVSGSIAPVITKNPTGETIVEGGRDSFIARADNATSITWYFDSSDGRSSVKASDAAGYFSGLSVSGYNTEQLTVSNVPLSLDGWSAKALFEGPGGYVYSNSAMIRVKKAELKTPVINTPPADANLKSGESITLTVSASSPDGNKLSYQWYKADKAGDAKGEAIPGATSASYTVKYEEGTFYYYCMVYNNRNGEISAPARTASAKVVGAAAAPTAKPSASPAPSAKPSAEPTEAPQQSAEPTAAPIEKPAEKADHTVAYIIGGVAAIALICATLVVIQRGAAKRNPERYSEQIKRADEYRQSRHTK